MASLLIGVVGNLNVGIYGYRLLFCAVLLYILVKSKEITFDCKYGGNNMKIANDRKMLVAAGAAVVALGTGTVGVNADTVRAAVNNGNTPDAASNSATSTTNTATDQSTNTTKTVSSETDPSTGKTTTTITTSKTTGTPSQIADQQSNVNKASEAVSAAQSAADTAQTKADATSAAASSADTAYASAASSQAQASSAVSSAASDVNAASSAQQAAQAAADKANDKAVKQQQSVVDQAKAQTQTDTQAASTAQSQAKSQAAAVSSAAQAVNAASASVDKAQQNVKDKQKALNNIQGVDATKAQQHVDNAQAAVNKGQNDVKGKAAAQTQLDQKVADAQKAKDAADAKLNDHNQKVSAAQKQVNDAKTKVASDKQTVANTQKQLDGANNKLKNNKNETKQTLTVPSDLATKLSKYQATGKYENSQEDMDAIDKNNFVNSDKDNVKFDASVPMSDADRNYYNLYAVDLINQARAQVGLKPVVASELAKNFAKQVSDNYTAEHYGFDHDHGMLEKTSDQMNAGWTGENISMSNEYAVDKTYGLDYTVNDFKCAIYEAINRMLLNDKHSAYGHAINFLNPDVYSFGFSYRLGNGEDADGNIVLNFEGIENKSTVITDDTTELKNQAAKLETQLKSQKATTQADQVKLDSAVAALQALQNDNVQQAVADAPLLCQTLKRLLQITKRLCHKRKLHWLQPRVIWQQPKQNSIMLRRVKPRNRPKSTMQRLSCLMRRRRWLKHKVIFLRNNKYWLQLIVNKRL